MATLPAYRGIFGPQALAPDIRVGVSSVAVICNSARLVREGEDLGQLVGEAPRAQAGREAVGHAA